MAASTDKFEVRYDAKAKMLRITFRGFWSMDDVGAFRDACLAFVASMGPPPHRYDVLTDARALMVQSAEVSAGIADIDEVSKSMHDGRAAVVLGSMMNKLQAERTLHDDRTRIFLSLEDANAWLADGPMESL